MPSSIAQRTDLLLSFGVLSVLAMMVVPLPTPVLDVLVCTNLAVSALMLLSSLYVRTPLDLSSLPSLLLLSTLFRLGLNVSSTRLILAQADAGRVIDAFGSFVIQDNLVVGLVLFLILTIIQFVVIAQGSERVAEVAARFSLDAMPGRQMAIDAEIRAGSLTAEQARTQRAQLQRESQLYGALDGAMKFVKGDAIAALLITLINISAGLIIGVAQRDLPLSQALSTYALLTIGDGLASQLPALLVATAAGLTVTRVPLQHPHLAAEIQHQIFRSPTPLTVASVLFAALSLLPSLPFFPFALASGLLAVLAWRSYTHAHPTNEPNQPTLFDTPPLVTPIALHISPTLLTSPNALRTLREAFQRHNSDLHTRLGIHLSPPSFIPDPNTPARSFILTADTLPIFTATLPPNTSFTPVDPQTLRRLSLSPTPIPGLPNASLLPNHQRHPSSTTAPIETLASLIHAALHTQLPSLLTLQDTQNTLDALRSKAPQDVESVVPALLSLTSLHAVQQRLLQANLPIHPIRPTLTALRTIPNPQKLSPLELTEAIRSSFAPLFTQRHVPPSRTLPVFQLDRDTLSTLRSSITPSNAPTSPPSFAPPLETKRHLRRNATLLLSKHADSPILLVPQPLRPFLEHLLEEDIPNLVVLSPHDVEPDVFLQPLDTITARPNSESP